MKEKLKTVGAKLKPDTIAKLEKLAARRAWSLSQYVRTVLERHAKRAA
jgi:hypothetical protein